MSLIAWMRPLRLPFAMTRAWANQPLAIKGLVVVALPLAVLIGALSSLYLASQAEAQAEDDVRLAFAIQRDIYQVHALLAEAASGVRGYLLTEQERFLTPYYKAEAELPNTLTRLDESIVDAEVRTRFNRVMALTGRKRDGLSGLLEIADSAGSSAEDQRAIIAALEANKLVLDALRTEIDQIQVLETALLESRRARVDEVRRGYLALTAISAAVGLLGSLAAVYLFSTGIVRRVQMLEANAERLAQGEPLEPLPEDRDEVGRLAIRLERASALLRAREQALRDGEERFRLVVEGVQDYGIFALDPQGHVASWNAGAERIKGWRAEEVMGEHFSQFYPEETRNFLPQAILERASTQGAAEDEGWRLRKDGARFWANVVVTALFNEAGELRGFAKVTRDMTERKRSEEALRVAREEAIAASLAKSEFLSRTSHELRTPMSAILGFAQVLELDQGDLADRHRTAIDQILKSGRHLLSLIDDLLDISSIEAGGADITGEEINLVELVREADQLAGAIFAPTTLAFEVDLPDEAVNVIGDRRRINQVLLNILSNAAKYNREGQLVRLTCSVAGLTARIEVMDDGPGIAQADVPRLFTPFDRLGLQRIKGLEGTGLGLALSKRLIESMGGEIGFRNRPAPDRGAVFWFTLPLAPRSHV